MEKRTLHRCTHASRKSQLTQHYTLKAKACYQLPQTAAKKAQLGDI